MTKEERIKEEYEIVGLPFNDDIVHRHGWLKIKPTQYHSKHHLVDTIKHTIYAHSIRPKSLQGIENNAGWIRIESEADLPKNVITCFTYAKTTWHPFYRIDVFVGRLSNSFTDGKSCFTHYQIIEKPKPPLY